MGPVRLRGAQRVAGVGVKPTWPLGIGVWARRAIVAPFLRPPCQESNLDNKLRSLVPTCSGRTGRRGRGYGPGALERIRTPGAGLEDRPPVHRRRGQICDHEDNETERMAESRTRLARLGRPAARHEHTRAPPERAGEWSRRRESNPPEPPYHGGALPREQRRHEQFRGLPGRTRTCIVRFRTPAPVPLDGQMFRGRVPSPPGNVEDIQTPGPKLPPRPRHHVRIAERGAPRDSLPRGERARALSPWVGALGWDRTNTSAVSARRFHQVSFKRRSWHPVRESNPPSLLERQESWTDRRTGHKRGRRVESNHPEPGYEAGALPRERRRQGTVRAHGRCTHLRREKAQREAAAEGIEPSFVPA
jgi:hypothetical protein